jgi:hypothetical protein
VEVRDTMNQPHHPNPRWLSRRGLLQGAAAAAATVAWPRLGHTAEVEKNAAGQNAAARRALDRAVKYLWSQQADDGGWHSPQYGVLRSGQALTPFVLHALVTLPQELQAKPADGFDRAAAFLVQRIDARGSLGHDDPDIIEYPVYSTAYALRSFERLSQLSREYPAYARAAAARDIRLGRPLSKVRFDVQRELARFLAEAQFQESNGFTPSNPAYGGWGFDAPLKPGRPGHMDLAHTRRAIEALADTKWNHRAAPYVTIPEVNTRLEHFLRVVQKLPQAAARPQVAAPNQATLAPPPSLNSRAVDESGKSSAHNLPGDDPPGYDGGFYFSPVVLDANKGREDYSSTPPFWRSYATATCDGILALLAAGVRPEDERVTAAVAWLQSHTDLDYPQGVPTEHPEPWGEAIRFYHYAVRAEVYQRLGWPADERLRLATAVAAKQDPDGSFVNRESALMKEDDAVMCTALAVTALSNCLAIEEIHHNGTADTTR